MKNMPYKIHVPEKQFDVLESDQPARMGRAALRLDRDIHFTTEALESYAFSRWEPLLFDAMVVAAAVEYADKSILRPRHGWARSFELQIPVHDAARWNAPSVLNSLQDAASIVTGDRWRFEFVGRRNPAKASPSSNYLSLPVQTEAILAFSDGMDSRAVGGLIGRDLDSKLVRVRVGPKTVDRPRARELREPFTSVPYSIKYARKNKETSARSRGFKFALVTALAAYLTGAKKIVLPESGQGAIGPALITVGHGYPDYRNHPVFTQRMERFIQALLGVEIRYIFPRIWHTKGETLREFVAISGGHAWTKTKSCWRGSQWSSVNGKLRQCGVCAACMLRRLSVHAAGLTEHPETYVCTDMSASSLKEAVDPAFSKLNAAYEQYAIAGALHLDHLADLASDDAASVVRRHARLVAPALGVSASDAEANLFALLSKHAHEWRSFVMSLGENSFVKQWVRV